MPRIVVETAWEAGTSQTLLTVVEAAELSETLVPGRVPSTPIRHDSEPKTVSVPGAESVPARPAFFTSETSVLNLPAATAVWTMFF